MVNDWYPKALIESKCDVFLKTAKHPEFRNSLIHAGEKRTCEVTSALSLGSLFGPQQMASLFRVSAPHESGLPLPVAVQDNECNR
jgi:hypothetical protein